MNQFVKQWLLGINMPVIDYILTQTNKKGLFEATVRYSATADTFSVSPKELSRVNKYATAAHCVTDKYPHLALYCYCK